MFLAFVPLALHVANMPSAAHPYVLRELTAQDNCHGIVCYRTPFDVWAEDAMAYFVPAIFIFVGLGYYLSTGKRMDVRG